MKRLFIAAALFLFAACSSERSVVIVSTNDIHSSIENFPRLAALVEDLRSQNRDVLLIDAGDRWTGNPFVDLAERPLSPIVELQNELGYDLTTLGNHEFDWGQPLLGERVDEMNFQVVCANIEVGDGATLRPVAPYKIVEAGGIRFAFMGMVHNFTRWNRPEGKAEHFEGLRFPDVYDTAERYAPLADSADVFVGLTHIGYEADLALAKRVPSLDLIVGGHSHTVVDTAVVVGKTRVTQAGRGLKYAGVTTVTVKGRGRNARTAIENRLVMLDTIAPSPRFERMVEKYMSNPELLAPVGRTAAPMNKQGVQNMVVDAVRTATGADVAMYHAGGVRIDTLVGEITRADLFRVEPFLSEMYTVRMTAGEIKGMIIARFGESHSRDLIPSGVGYTITTDEAGEAVDVVFDRPEKRSYLVALPDYVVKNYVFESTTPPAQTGRQVTEMLNTWIAAHRPLAADNQPRIVIK